MYVKGVGPRLAESLKSKGIETVEDLLYYLPFRYEDRLNARTIAELKAGEMASVIAEVRTAMLFRTKRMPIFEVTFGQGRSTLKGIWFHGTYLKDKFKPGQLVALYGKVDKSTRGRGSLQVIQPQYEILAEPQEAGDSQGESNSERIERDADRKVEESLEIGRIVPIYESAANQKLTSRWFRNAIYRALQNLSKEMLDGVPRAIAQRVQLIDRREAFEHV